MPSVCLAFGLLVLLLAPAVAAAECTKDTDCKGERVCEQGACVAPSQPAPEVAPVSPATVTPENAPPPSPAPADVAATPRAPAPAAPAERRAETLFALDVRLSGFYGFDSNVSGGGGLAGVHAGGESWFSASPFGLLYMAGAEIGVLSSWARPSVPVVLSLEAGGELLLQGSRQQGLSVSLGWAPRLLLNVAGGEALSPWGLEAALRFGRFAIPVWFLETWDQSAIFGAGLAYRL